ncbi:BglG family transcription antiterminator [Liquorilactobacillus mali]|nr:BglG family transcription antiterminator [Liquorilactobacillus mali]EJE97944.1 licABCH operon regulator [Liquorilactobacillus mali KCTC 3596 = DSM 20444]MDC7953745.1 transcription antiterminator [Liquorilactobacillus mali]
MFNLDEIDVDIIKFILTNKKVHYEDIIQLIGLSRVTVVKRLDKISSALDQLNIKLIRRKGDGIYFVGDVYQLLNRLHSSNKNMDSRTNRSLMILLLSEKILTVQELADKLYVSRNTLQSNLKDVRKILATNKLQLRTTNKGLVVCGSENSKRHVISEILDEYWNTFSIDTGENNSNIFNEKWIRIFNKRYLNKILFVIRNSLKKSHIDCSDYQIKNLVIHIAIILQRIKTNHCLEKKSNNKYKQLNETEELVKAINKEFKVRLPNLEKEYLNLHVVTFKDMKADNDSKNFKIKLMRNFLVKAVKDVDPDDILISDLTLHLCTTIDRLKKGLAIKNPYTADIKKNFPYSFDLAVQLASKIQAKFKVVLFEDEIAYITLHFQNFMEREAYDSRINAVIVCSTGLGMSRFLEQEVSDTYHDKINILQVMSLTKFEQTSISVPLVLSTVNIVGYSGNVVTVSPLLEQIDKKKINIAIERILINNRSYRIFSHLISLNQIYVNEQLSNANQVISFLGKELINKEFAKSGVIESALEREEISSTVIKNMAVPHSKVKYIIKPSISILLNKNGIEWGNKKVYLVFFIGLNNSVIEKSKEIYKYFSKLIYPEFIKKACKCNSSEEIYELIMRHLKEVSK